MLALEEKKSNEEPRNGEGIGYLWLAGSYKSPKSRRWADGNSLSVQYNETSQG